MQGDISRQCGASSDTHTLTHTHIIASIERATGRQTQWCRQDETYASVSITIASYCWSWKRKLSSSWQRWDQPANSKHQWRTSLLEILLHFNAAARPVLLANVLCTGTFPESQHMTPQSEFSFLICDWFTHLFGHSHTNVYLLFELEDLEDSKVSPLKSEAHRSRNSQLPLWSKGRGVQEWDATDPSCSENHTRDHEEKATTNCKQQLVLLLRWACEFVPGEE